MECWNLFSGGIVTIRLQSDTYGRVSELADGRICFSKDEAAMLPNGERGSAVRGLQQSALFSFSKRCYRGLETGSLVSRRRWRRESRGLSLRLAYLDGLLNRKRRGSAGRMEDQWTSRRWDGRNGHDRLGDEQARQFTSGRATLSSKFGAERGGARPQVVMGARRGR